VAPKGVTHLYNQQANDSLSATITTVNTTNGKDDNNEDDIEEVTNLDKKEKEQNSCQTLSY
jgi:hypothetical protein